MALDIATALWGAVVLLVVVALYYKDKKKKVSYRNFMAMGAGLTIILLITGMPIPILQDTTVDIPGIPSTTTPSVVDADVEVKLYDKVSVTTQEKGSNSYTAIAGTVSFFEKGVDITQANAQALDTATVTSGVGNTTAAKMSSGIEYQVILETTNGYDMYLNDEAVQQLPYVKTTSGTISNTNIRFSDVMSYATISDMIDESSTSGVVNGQTSAVNVTTATNEICLSSATPADDDDMVYDESVGDGIFYIDVDIAFTGGNKYIKDPVMDFVWGLSNKPEGNEFSSVSAELRTGTDLGIPSDLTAEVNSEGSVSLGTVRSSGISSTYRLTFDVDESALDDGADILYIVIDDNGEYGGQDLMRGTKATASDLITIKSQA